MSSSGARQLARRNRRAVRRPATSRTQRGGAARDRVEKKCEPAKKGEKGDQDRVKLLRAEAIAIFEYATVNAIAPGRFTQVFRNGMASGEPRSSHNQHVFSVRRIV